MRSLWLDRLYSFIDDLICNRVLDKTDVARFLLLSDHYVRQGFLSRLE